MVCSLNVSLVMKRDSKAYTRYMIYSMTMIYDYDIVNDSPTPVYIFDKMKR